MSSLKSGANKLAGGAKQFSQGANKLASSANQLAPGSKQVTNGIAQINAAMGNEVSGLSKVSAGASKMQTGVGKVQNFLHRSRLASDPGFYIPQSTLDNNKNLQQAMDSYISSNGRIAKFTVVLNDNPYSMTAINTMNPLQQAAKIALNASPVGKGTVYIGGTTGTQANMNSLSNQDFVRTISIVFITIFLLLVALGVDYCIFLTSRFDEEYRAGRNPISAMRHLA